MPPTDSSHSELRRLLARASRDLSRALENGLRVEEMRLVDYEVLRCAAGSPGCIQRDLAAALNVDPSAIVAVLDKFEEAGCAKRRHDEGDQRRRLVATTAVGHRTLRRCGVIVRRVEEGFFGHLEADEQWCLARLLARLSPSGTDREATQETKAKGGSAAGAAPHPPGSRRWS